MHTNTYNFTDLLSQCTSLLTLSQFLLASTSTSCTHHSSKFQGCHKVQQFSKANNADHRKSQNWTRTVTHCNAAQALTKVFPISCQSYKPSKVCITLTFALLPLAPLPSQINTIGAIYTTTPSDKGPRLPATSHMCTPALNLASKQSEIYWRNMHHQHI